MLFKKKKCKKPDGCKVVFKQKGTLFQRRKERKKVLTKAHPIKSVKRRGNPRGDKIKKIRQKNFVFNLIFLAILLGVCLFGGYIVINFIVSIRGDTSSAELMLEKTYVEGIENVPIYPRSEFVYKDRMDEDIVIQMLSRGLSVYRLPRNTKTTDVYEYYDEELTLHGWEHLLTVPISTAEQLFGQYWIKEERGLRLYVENNDVWYELLTKSEAQTALSERRIAEIQRKRILESSSEQTLLPDFPWQMSIPREYLTKYSSTDFGEFQAVEIYEIGGPSKFFIYPIGKSDSGTYDKMLDEFFQKQRETLEEQWEVINTRVDFQKDREVLVARVLISEDEGEGIVLMNRRNFMIYAIIANKVEHPFFQEIITNISEP